MTNALMPVNELLKRMKPIIVTNKYLREEFGEAVGDIGSSRRERRAAKRRARWIHRCPLRRRGERRDAHECSARDAAEASPTETRRPGPRWWPPDTRAGTPPSKHVKYCTLYDYEYIGNKRSIDRCEWSGPDHSANQLNGNSVNVKRVRVSSARA